LDPHTLGSYKKLSDAFGTTTDRAGNVSAGATLPTVDEVRQGQLTARIAGQNAQLSDVLGTKVDRLGNVIAAPAMPAFFKDGGLAESEEQTESSRMLAEMPAKKAVQRFAAGGPVMSQEEFQSYVRGNPEFSEDQIRQSLIGSGKNPPPKIAFVPAIPDPAAPVMSQEEFQSYVRGNPDFSEDQIRQSLIGSGKNPPSAKSAVTTPAVTTPAVTTPAVTAPAVTAPATTTLPVATPVTPPATPYAGNTPIALAQGPAAFSLGTRRSSPGGTATPMAPSTTMVPAASSPVAAPALRSSGMNEFEKEVLKRSPASAETPAFFKDGGEVTGGNPSLDDYLQQQMAGDQDSSAALFGNAQKLMSDFNEVPKIEPMRRIVKKVSRGSGGDSKTDKNMSIKVPPLAASKDLDFNLPSAQEAAQTKNMGSAREQMEELARVYQLKINAAKNKARGLAADTFGAPTLEGPTLVKKSLTKQRFAKGGEVKNDEVAEPSLFSVNEYATKASARMFPDQLGQDDQRDAARHMLAAGSVARKYGPRAADLLGKAHERMSNPQSFFSMFGIGQPRDDLPYDVHNNRIGAELAARATSQAELEKLVQAMALQAQTKQTKDKPYIMSREQMQARKERAEQGAATTDRPEYRSKK
jgi:uncharacterized protein YneF (UPF0154 family)